MADLYGSILHGCERRHACGRRYLHDVYPDLRVKWVGSFGGYLLLSLASGRCSGTAILVGFEIILAFLMLYIVT